MAAPEPATGDPAAASGGGAAAAAAEARWREAVVRGILGDEARCDVTFVVQGQRLHALRHLCAAHSEVFGAARKHHRTRMWPAAASWLAARRSRSHALCS